MIIYDIIFYFFALMTIGSAVLAVTLKNVVRAAFSLFFTLFGMAGLYVLLAADFVAIVQIMVYVGGILVLLLFGVMLTNKITGIDIKSVNVNFTASFIAIIGFCVFILAVLLHSQWHISILTEPEGTIKQIGHKLLTDYIFVFELLGVFLLVALIGAASIARQKKPEIKGEEN